MADGSAPKKPASRKFQAPKGTRDFYPEDQLRKRYIVETWRAVSLRHGFEEIDGPTFEHLDLYTVKSGEGIVSELFSFQRQGGDDTYALRPEFTPTLARMYAARAAQLPKPVRWFCVPSFFRAERPQRGRLREFLQWNCDVIGGEFTAEGAEGAEGAEKKKSEADGEILSITHACVLGFGLSEKDVIAGVNDRTAVVGTLRREGILPDRIQDSLRLIDAALKLGPEFGVKAKALGFSSRLIELFGISGIESSLSDPHAREQWKRRAEWALPIYDAHIAPMVAILKQTEIHDFARFHTNIVRGLAYYTGMVFEVIAEGERAVAGGGRYDNLIELLGGPPTPAVGFAMGDVVLANLLEDKGLMPSAAELPGAVEAVVRSQRLRPEVFVVSGGEEDDALVVPLVARLRRGIEAEGFAGKPWEAARYAGDGGGVKPLHARSSDKATRNVKKLLQDAVKQGARLFCEIHGAEKVELKDLDTQTPVEPPEGHASFSVDPSAPNYVGRAVVGVVG